MLDQSRRQHFANRRELLGALDERDAARLHAELAAAVEAADGFEAKARALVHGAIDAQATRGATFAALDQAGARQGHTVPAMSEHDLLRWTGHRRGAAATLPRHAGGPWVTQ